MQHNPTLFDIRSMFFLLALADQILADMRRSRKCQFCNMLEARFAYSCCYTQGNKHMKTCYPCLRRTAIRDITFSTLRLIPEPVKQVCCPSCKTKNIRFVNSSGHILNIRSVLQVSQITEAACAARVYFQEAMTRFSVDELRTKHELLTRVMTPLIEILHFTDDTLLSLSNL